MKSNRVNIFLSAIFIILICLSPAFAGEIIIDKEKKTKFEILENSYSVLKITNTVSSVGFKNIETKQGIFTRLQISDFGRSLTPGEPELPILKQLIEIPLGAEINILITNLSFNDYIFHEYGITNVILPAQPPVSKNIDNPEDLDFIINEQTYLKDQFIGQEIVSIEFLGTMRGVRLARLEISPVQYNPILKTIRVYNEIEAEITFTNANIGLTENNKKTLFSPFTEHIYSRIINYKSLSIDELIMNAPATYVIVSDPMFESTLQPFIEWKTRKGFRIIEAYTDDPLVGNTTTSIKTYLEDLYNNPPEGYLPQSFVLIVGDVDQVPSFDGIYGYHATDLYYGEYTGDVFPECYYGRFSANNIAELEPQVNKTLEYEKYEFPEPSFLDSALLVAGAATGIDTIWGNGHINYAANNYINENHDIYPFIYPQPAPPGINYQELIMERFNNGISFFNYTGHCSYFGFSEPMFTTAQVFQLTNAHKYPLVIGNCCNPAAFHVNCFGEAIVRAVDKGALSFIGATSSTYWDEDYWWAVGFKEISANPVYDPESFGFYDRWFHDHGEPVDEWFVTQGQFPAAGNLAVTESGSSLSDYYWETYHVLGDPSVCIYLPEPNLPEVSYASTLSSEDTVFIVTTDPYLYVALSMNGALHGAAVSGENGVAEISIIEPFIQSGVAEIIVTGQNIEPYFGTVDVIQTSTSEFNSVIGQIIIHPNPFNEKIIIDCNLNSSTELRISLFDLLGKSVENINFNIDPTTGKQRIEIKTKNLNPGIYFCRFEAGTFTETHKIIKTN